MNNYGLDNLHSCDNPECLAFTDALHVPLNPIYKVVIGEDAADNIADAILFSRDLHTPISTVLFNRVSPIVVYSRLTDMEAVELAQTPGMEVTRARADWSI